MPYVVFFPFFPYRSYYSASQVQNLSVLFVKHFGTSNKHLWEFLFFTFPLFKYMKRNVYIIYI